MANRHKFARGGRSGGRPLYAGAASKVASEINETHGFKRGGVAVGKAFGGRAKGKAGYARGGRSPFSSANFGSKGPHAGTPNAGGSAKHAKGGAVYARGGAVAKRGGGECEPPKRKHEEEEEDDEEEEHKRGGAAGMHYVGGRGRRRRKDGGHIDIYKTEGGTHHWKDDDHSKARGGRNWIAGAIKHPGALHKELGVPEGEKIPAKKLAKAEHSDSPKLAKRARLAETLKGLHP